MFKKIAKAMIMMAGLLFVTSAYAQQAYNMLATAYVTTTISQKVVFDSSMQAGGTFTLSVLAHNGGGRANQSDTANVKIQFYTAGNALVTSVNTNYSANLPNPNAVCGNPCIDPNVPWTTLSTSATLTAAQAATVAYATISMYGVDGSFWAGDYGPWYQAPTFTFNGGANLAYNPEFGPYNGVNAQGWTTSPAMGACQGAWGGSNPCIANSSGQPGQNTTGLVANANGGGPDANGGTVNGTPGGYNSTMDVTNAPGSGNGGGGGGGGSGPVAVTNPSGTTDTNPSGTTTLAVTNSGTYTNDGTTGDVTNNSGGVYTNNGTGGDITNSGTFTNSSGGTVGDVTNNSGGTFTNSGTTGAVTNAGTFTNNSGGVTGVVTNSGTFTNNSGGTTGAVTNTGTFTNAGTTGNVTNNNGGTFNNNAGGTTGTVTNNSGGIFNNRGTVTTVTNAGTFTNYSTGVTGAFTNSGTLTNAGRVASLTNTGTASNSGTITGSVTNNGSGTFTNSGTTGNWTNNATMSNTGTMGNGTNNGTYTNGGTTGSVTNSGTFTNNSNGTTGAFTNNGTLTSAGTVASLTNTGTATNTGTVTGTVTNTSGSFTNSGTTGNWTNSGTITNSGSMGNGTNNSSFTNTGTTGTVTNTGTFANNGGTTSSMTNSGTLTNDSTGTIADLTNTGTATNDGTITGSVTNTTGTFTNNGTTGSWTNSDNVVNSGTMGNGINYAGATFTNNSAGTVGDVTNSGTFTNSGTTGTFTNSGTADNNGGTMGDVTNSTGGTFTNWVNSVVANLTNDATATNDGTITGSVTNNGTFTNTGTAGDWTNTSTLTNSGTLGNGTNSGTMTMTAGNVGTVNNSGTFGLSGGTTSAVTNSGTLNYTGGTVDSISNTGTYNVTGTGNNIALNGYTQGTNGTTIMNIAPNGSQLFTVNGPASLGGTLQLNAASGPYSYGRIPLLAANSISGHYDTLTLNPDNISPLGYELVYSGNDVKLSVTPNSTGTVQGINAIAADSSTMNGVAAGQSSGILGNDCGNSGPTGGCMSVSYGVNNIGTGNLQSGGTTITTKVNDRVRVGIVLDQMLNTPSTDTVKYTPSSPAIGTFIGWNNGKGLDVTASAANASGQYTITRPTIANAESGTGSPLVNSQAVQVKVAYTIPAMNDISVTPYAGIRYSNLNVGGYTETGAVYPLTMNPYSQNSTDAIAGVTVSKKLTDKLTASASVGVTRNLSSSPGSVTGTSNIVGTKTFESQLPKGNDTSVGVGAGLSYEVAKGQHINLNVGWHQKSLTTPDSTSVGISYSFAF